ncbi:sodium:solute symporter family protein [Poriferisphaera sp. WC338]|uniref:sodium:solute symporter family protein n=1 Tax=Poriferisphaera sp. WC338 TaxID=3425129 RepID=UPI003D815828
MGSNLDLTIVGIYMIVLILIGVVFSRLVRNGSDYFRAGARGSWWLVGASMFMSGISAYTFVGNAAGIYKSGWSPLAIYGANVVGFIIGGLFLAAWYRQMRVITFAEVLKARFGKTAEQVVAYLLVFNGYIWAGVVLYTLAIFSKVLIPDLPIQYLIIGVGVIVVFYCTIGGKWAVMANDFVQGLVLVIVTVIITVLCFKHAGGISEFFSAISSSDAASDLKFFTEQKEDEVFRSAKYGFTWIVVAFLVQFFNMSSLFQGVRYFSAKDGREAAKASIFAGVLMTLGCIVFFVPPIYARLFLSPEVAAMNPDDTSKAVEYAYSITAYHILPKGTFSIMIIAMFAAAISSLDTGLNTNAALIVRDLLPPILRKINKPSLTAKQEVIVGKIATIFSGVIVIGIATLYAAVEGMSIFDFMLKLSSILIFPQMIPLVLFLFVRKVPRWSIFISIAAGYIPSILNYAFGWELSYQELSAAILVAGTTGYFIPALFWKHVPESQRKEVQNFYDNMQTPVDFDTEVGQSNDTFQLKNIGLFAFILGLLFLFLMIPVQDNSGRIVVAIVAGFIASVGLLMLLAAKRIAKKEAQHNRPVQVESETIEAR